MTLLEALLKIDNNERLGVWAKYPFTSQSEARIGDRHFINGGVPNDGLVYFDNAINIYYYLLDCIGEINDYSDDDLSDAFEDAALNMINSVMEYWN